ncbi:type VI secretion system baseplate subunit TssK [Acetobacteraceae bacterium]|nr:type VI secretion system baseplate subunit TssK [Acetobacteraceae bacterium]
MSKFSRVFWQEGMFLRTQHFQQQDRWISHDLASSFIEMNSCCWGLKKYEINEELLSSGQICLLSASGFLRDGTRFNLPQEGELPNSLTINDNASGKLVYLALPNMSAKRLEFSADESSAERFKITDAIVQDSYVADLDDDEPIQVANLNFKLLLEKNNLEGYQLLPIAKILEVDHDHHVILDQNWIPPVIVCRASAWLKNIILEIYAVLRQRAEAISSRLGAIKERGTTEISDFMLLQRINVWHSVMGHYVNYPALSPERLFTFFLEIAGELATFTSEKHLPDHFPVYAHENLFETFSPVIHSIQKSLSSVFEQAATPIKLNMRKHNVRVGPLHDKSILESDSIVLAVSADTSIDILQRLFPSKVKIGAVEHIRDLVNISLPGIGIHLLPVAPRQMPFIPNALYFELDKHSDAWHKMQNSAAFAIHVSHEFPNLKMELWALRS